MSISDDLRIAKQTYEQMNRVKYECALKFIYHRVNELKRMLAFTITAK